MCIRDRFPQGIEIESAADAARALAPFAGHYAEALADERGEALAGDGAHARGRHLHHDQQLSLIHI